MDCWSETIGKTNILAERAIGQSFGVDRSTNDGVEASVQLLKRQGPSDLAGFCALPAERREGFQKNESSWLNKIYAGEAIATKKRDITEQVARREIVRPVM